MNMHDIPPFENRGQSPAQPPRRAEFHPALALNLMMTGVMSFSIAYALGRFVSMLVAVPVAIAIGAVFGHMAHRVLDTNLPARQRVAAGCAAALIFLVTVGLSAGTLYATVFAEQSALRYFEDTRRVLMTKVNAQLANAETARQALQAWADSSKTKAEEEAKTGGSCPAKPDSTGVRGPIAKWREAEMQIAADLAAAFTERMKQARARIDPVHDRLARDFAESLEIGVALNAGVESVEALAHGAFPGSVQDTLKRQATSRITWKNGEQFACADIARDEVIARAVKAVADLQAGAAIDPLRPAIDLRQDKEVMVRGLLRSFNLAAAWVTVGLVGSFEDDPLMAAALKKGVINRETLPFALSAVIEMMVFMTAAWARERGSAPLPFEPLAWVEQARARRAAARHPVVRGLLGLWHALMRACINVFYAVPEAPAEPEKHRGSDPQLDARELGWADMLLPWVSYVFDCAYLAIPIVSSTARARDAARCMDEDGFAVLLASSAPWAQVSSSPEFAHRVELMLPDAKQKRYEIYRLSPGTAQAFRLHWLGPSPSSHGKSAAEAGKASQ